MINCDFLSALGIALSFSVWSMWNIQQLVLFGFPLSWYKRKVAEIFFFAEIDFKAFILKYFYAILFYNINLIFCIPMFSPSSIVVWTKQPTAFSSIMLRSLVRNSGIYRAMFFLFTQRRTRSIQAKFLPNQ